MKKEDTKKTLIISGLILPIIAGIMVEIFTTVEVLKALQQLLSSLWDFMTQTISLPLLGVLMLPILGFGLCAAIIVWKRHRDSKHDVQEDFRSYTSDHLFGVDWQWRWYAGGVRDLVLLCPECKHQPDLEVDYKGRSVYNRGSKIKCDNCGFHLHWEEQGNLILKT